ncbi:MAG: LysM peptidoglycan-binding domain-containing protein [Anaerolineales bacterium]|jgi:hypothetical protein
MAQNDVFKEIVFIADQQYEAPAVAWGVALAYLLALVVAEVLTTFASPLVGIILYGLVLLALLVHSTIGAQKGIHNFLLVLSTFPLIRLLVLTNPFSNIPPIYWYLLLGILLGVAAYITARLTGLAGSTIGLRVTKSELPLQLLIGLGGLAVGFIGYLILRPEPLTARFNGWQAALLLIYSGLLIEIIFRGMLQTSAVQVLGRLGILYAVLVSVLLYVGYRSLPGLLFILLLSLAFAFIAARTRCLVGVSLSHGLANISFFLLFPLLLANNTPGVEPPLAVSIPPTGTPTRVIEVSPLPTETIAVQQPLVLIPITGRTATPEPATEQMSGCDAHPNWVVYVVQGGDTLTSIAAVYGINAAELAAANCLAEDLQVRAGQGLFVPFDLLPTLTPTQRVLFSALNTPTVTPTRKPTRKPGPTATTAPVQKVTPIPSFPTSTLKPPPPTPQELPTLAPTQLPPPPAP